MPLFDNLADWQQAGATACEQAARTLEPSLPDGFRFDAIRSIYYAGRQCEIAQFTLGTARFSLVPGGVVTLGFDAKDWEPTADMLESWRGTAEGYRIEQSLHDFIHTRTSASRTLTLAPMLVETQAKEVGWQTIDPASETVQALLRKHPKGVTQFSDIATRVTVSNGVVHAEQADENALSYEQVVADYTDAGFRLPTPDEWEYLCSAGARTLFRWGDHVPCDRYPYDRRPKDATDWREWEAHRESNLFGLHIADDPYKMELTSVAGFTLGGDGGTTTCGGAGFLVGWLPLASAWIDPDFCRHEPGNEVSLGYTVARRVLTVG